MMLKKQIKKIWRFPICKYYQSKLKTRKFSIISSNCVGGCLYHDLGLQFTSPTINLIIPESLKFFENLKHYLSIEPVADGYTEKGEPVAIIDDVKIIGVHYKDHNHLIKKWTERTERVIWDNIIILSDSRYIKTPQEVERFSKLPYHKALFTGELTGYDFEVLIPKLKDGDLDITSYCDMLGRRYFEKYLNCVAFINESEKFNGKKQ